MAIPTVVSTVIGILRAFGITQPGTGVGSQATSPFRVGTGTQTVTITVGANSTIHQGTGALIVGDILIGDLSLLSLWLVSVTTGSLRAAVITRSLEWGSAATGLSGEVAGVIRSADGAGANPTWVQQTPARRRVAADVTNDSDTLAAVTGLSFDVKAGRKYSFICYLYATTGAVLEGVKAALSGTATVTNLVAEMEIKSHASTPVFTVDRVSAFGSAVGQTVADAGDAQVEISGTFEVNAAGTFLVQFAKNADTGAAVTTIRRGSWMLVEDMP